MKISGRWSVVFILLTLVLAAATEVKAKKIEVPGVLAVSAWDTVTLVSVANEGVRRVETGPVGFLFPGPGGVLFAPDLVNGRTTILDVHSGRVLEQISGVTMPRFGPWKDRYLVAAGALTIVSYPERSFISRMEGDFRRLWQIEIAPEGTSLLILERKPSGKSGAVLSAVDLSAAQVVHQRKFSSDLTRFAVASSVGLLVAADPRRRRIRLLDPASFGDVHQLPIDGEPVDVVVMHDGKDLFVAGATGKILRWRLTRDRKGVQAKELKSISVDGRVLRLTVGLEGKTFAAVTDAGRLLVIRSKDGELLASWEVPLEPRDLVWCDPKLAGPLLPSWSDRGGGLSRNDLSRSDRPSR